MEAATAFVEYPVGLPDILLAGDPGTLIEGPPRTLLEQTILPQFLASQRWFGGKARGIESVRITDSTPLMKAPAAVTLVLLDVHFAGGGTEAYFVPLGVVLPGDSAERMRFPSRSAIARLTTPAGDGLLFDALADESACRELLLAIGAGREFRCQSGHIRAFPTAAYADGRGQAATPLGFAASPSDQSNSSILFPPRWILKVFRRLETGLNPDFEIGRYLTEQAGFADAPRTAGAIEYVRPGSEPITLAMLQGLVPHHGNGWEQALQAVRRYFESLVAAGTTCEPGTATGGSPPRSSPLAAQSQLSQDPAGYSQFARKLGRCTAQLHLALGRATRDPAFAPEPITQQELAAWSARAQDTAASALETLAGRLEHLPGSIRDEARTLLAHPSPLFDMLRRLEQTRPSSSKIRCHGDYHLGQVLATQDGFVILDFEGEPARSLSERRAKHSPLKDVAGMFRSFDYAACAGLFAFVQDRHADVQQVEPLARNWQRGTWASFWDGYQQAASHAPFLPQDPEQLQDLLDFFIVDKALYELLYELNNRPDWVRIPLRGILSLLERR